VSFSGDRFIVTEKSLELNITNELINTLGATAIGFSQQQERLTGGDVYFPVDPPFILQYKRPYDGQDLVQARFRINSNEGNTQHRVLDLVSRRRLCDVYYVFPIIVRNRVFLRSMGTFAINSVFVPPERITDSVSSKAQSWMRTSHIVTVTLSNRGFVVRSSEEGKGFGLSKDGVLGKIRDRLATHQRRESAEDLPSFVQENIGAMRGAVREAGIMKKSEHTISYVAQRRQPGKEPSTGYLSVTTQL